MGRAKDSEILDYFKPTKSSHLLVSKCQ